MKALPSNQALWTEFKDRGLHIFLVDCQGTSKADSEKYARDRGLTFPIVIHAESSFEKYDGMQRLSLPYSYVIGPDGKVAWQGKGDYSAEVRKQLARIKYPKLKRVDVSPEIVPAAMQFEAGEFAAAKAAAEKIKAAAPNEKAVEDAEYVIQKVEENVQALRARIDELKEGRRYHEALPELEKLAGKAYKGLEEQAQAAEELKRLKKEPQVQAELKAWEALKKTLESNKQLKTVEDRRKALQKFIDKHKDTAAAEEAATMIEAVE